MMKRLLFVLVCPVAMLLLPPDSFGQNINFVKSELQKISSVYTCKKGISFFATTHFYKSGSNESGSNSSYSFSAKGGAYYMKVSNVERMSNKKLSLVVDHGEKMVVIGKPDVDMLGQVVSYKKLQQSTLDACSRIEIIPDSNNQRGFVFHFKDQPYASVRLMYNVSTMVIEQMTVTYLSGDRIEMFYTDFKYKVPDETIFSGSLFIQSLKKKNKKELPFTLTPKYAQYRIVNHYN